jgi:hypothetical protein
MAEEVETPPMAEQEETVLPPTTPMEAAELLLEVVEAVPKHKEMVPPIKVETDRLHFPTIAAEQ